MGLVPTASTAALHAMGDALAMTLLRSRHFGSEEYALLHPGGKLGRSVHARVRGDAHRATPTRWCATPRRSPRRWW